MLGLETKLSQGFSFIEVVIILTFLGVVFVGFYTSVCNQMNAFAYLNDKLSRQDLRVEIGHLLNDERACGLTFKEIKIPQRGASVSLSPIHFVDASNEPAFESLTYDQLEFNNMTLKNLNIQNAQDTGLMELSVYLNRKRTDEDFPHLRNLRYKLKVQVDLITRKIKSCSGGMT